MEISPDILERIRAAADALYETSGRKTIPTVDAVRKQAKVNMNDASIGMRAWRREHASGATTPTVHVPEALQMAGAGALASLWSEAVCLAKEALRAAQAGWERERAEAEAMADQMARAFDLQTQELLATQVEVQRLKVENCRFSEAMAASQELADTSARQRRDAEGAAALAQANAEHSERRADDLRKALDHAQSQVSEMKRDSEEQRRIHLEESSRLHTELQDMRRFAERESATAQAELRAAVEEAATLRGKLSVLAEAPPAAPGHLRARRREDEARN